MVRPTPREEAPDDALTLAHGDPDLRPGIIADGLVLNGVDPFAERRRRIREAHDGRPDPTPAPAPARAHTHSERRDTVTLNTRPLSQVDTAATRRPEAPPAPGDFRIITPAEFAALPAGRYSVSHALSGAVEALARGEHISLAVPTKRVPSTRQTLRKLAKERGLRLEIRSGPDFVAARAAGPLTAKKGSRPE